MTKQAQAEEFDFFVGGDRGDIDAEIAQLGSPEEVFAAAGQPMPKGYNEPEQAPEPEPEPEQAPEPEPEPEPEQAPEPDPASAPPPPPEPRIPKSRFDEVNERMKAAEARLAQIEAERAAAPEPTFDFAAKEEEYAGLMADGEFAKAAAIRAEIRAAERAEVQQMIRASGNDTVSQTQQQLEFQAAVAELTAQYPVFDESHESFDSSLLNDAVARRDFWQSTGLSPASALRKAVAETVKLNDIASISAPPPPPPPPPPPKGPDVPAKVAAASKQPPLVQGGASGGEPEVNIFNMTDEEYASLPERTKARLRGDYRV